MNRQDKEEIYHRELDTLLRFSALINSSLNIENVLENAMKWAEEFMGAEASSVYELDEEKNQLFIRLARGEKKEPIRGITLKVGEGIAGSVLESGRPMVIQNVADEKRFSDKFDRVTGFKTRSMICVPMLLRDKPMGVIQVINKKSGEPFNQSDLELLVGMAQLITVATENAKLYRRMEEKFELTTRELRVTQEKLIRSGRLAAMGHLVQGVAHEVRNPVTTIGGFARRIKREVIENPRLLKYVDIILEESARLERLVEEVREFIEVQAAELSPGDLGALLVEVARDFESAAGRQGVSIVRDIPGDLPQVEMDRTQMATALFNLLENALDAMPSGGRLTLELVQDGESLLIRVSDTGQGIDEDQMDSLYDPFVTSKPRGAGLGLTMVHQIIMNHQGEIKIHSEIRKGTTVTLRLPVHREPKTQE